MKETKNTLFHARSENGPYKLMYKQIFFKILHLLRNLLKHVMNERLSNGHLQLLLWQRQIKPGLHLTHRFKLDFFIY